MASALGSRNGMGDRDELDIERTELELAGQRHALTMNTIPKARFVQLAFDQPAVNGVA